MKETPTLDELIEFGEGMVAKFPEDFALKVALEGLKEHRRTVRADCPYNHWSIVHGTPEGRYCQYCGEDISRFRGAKWASDLEKAEDDRAWRARR